MKRVRAGIDSTAQPGSLRLGLATLALMLCATGAQAQGAQARDARVAKLERNLRERDKVISELLDRVESLERRVGVRHMAAGNDDDAKTTAAPSTPGKPGTSADRSPGTVVVEEGAAERALERSLTLRGALLLPAGVLEIAPGLIYTRREDAAPSVVVSSGTLFAGETRRNIDSFTSDLALRLGLPWDSQLEIGIPYRRRQSESVTSVGFSPTGSTNSSATGIGDVRLGLAKTLLREGLWHPDLVARVTWDSTTGKAHGNDLPLGSGFHELTGSLTAIKRQDPVAFVGGLSYQYAFERDQIRPGSTISANFGGVVALSAETSLQFTVSAAHQRATEFSGQAFAGTSQTAGTFVVGGSTLLARGILVNLSAGIGLTKAADDFSIMLSLPIRFSEPLF